MQILSLPGDIVLDPFGGSGTTALEAIKVGRDIISADRLEMCTFLASTKLAIASSPPSRTDIAAILAYLALPESRPQSLLGTGLEDWYSKDTLGELGFINELISICNHSVRPLLEIIFSNTLFACASPGESVTSTGLPRRHHWGWVADNVIPKLKKYHSAAAFFQYELIKFQTAHDLFHPMNARHLTIRHDARCMPFRDESVDCIITSPPYIGMIDYAKSHRLTYMWKGWDISSDRGDEIGARFKRSRQSILAEYLDDMSRCLNEMSRVMRPGAYCALIIGESRAFGGTVESVLTKTNPNFKLIWGPKSRTPSRRRVSDRLGREALEQICVFQRQ